MPRTRVLAHAINKDFIFGGRLGVAAGGCLSFVAMRQPTAVATPDDPPKKTKQRPDAGNGGALLSLPLHPFRMAIDALLAMCQVSLREMRRASKEREPRRDCFEFFLVTKVEVKLKLNLVCFRNFSKLQLLFRLCVGEHKNVSFFYTFTKL